ncbi:hypothetical protein Tco_1264301 [Tanacetum coccineum]
MYISTFLEGEMYTSRAHKGAEEVQRIIHTKAKYSNKENFKDDNEMQILKLRDDQKRLQVKEIKLEYARNIVTNSRVTPSWREIVSLTFSEAGVLHGEYNNMIHSACTPILPRLRGSFCTLETLMCPLNDFQTGWLSWWWRGDGGGAWLGDEGDDVDGGCGDGDGSGGDGFGGVEMMIIA